MDDQVKIDGFRIELAEIEAVFGTHPLVDKAVAVVRNHQLVLYIKPVPPVVSLSKEQVKEVRSHAAKSLTYYMMPK
jgi:acyl-coenzyme A synthetase/AMP-(fatty) acid ligase